MAVICFSTVANGQVLLQGRPGMRYLIKRVYSQGLNEADDTCTSVGVTWQYLEYNGGPNAAATVECCIHPPTATLYSWFRDWKDLNLLAKPGASIMGKSVGGTIGNAYFLIEYEEVFA